MKAEVFDAATCPLEGQVFIEASAGTGKTFSITSLVLRILLEGRAQADQILLVTYTNAATDELKRRVSERILAAYRSLESGAIADDPLVESLLKLRQIKPADALQRLADGVALLEEVPVLTIHGFCQRLLQDHAFETGQVFQFELLTNEEPLLENLVRDFWHRRVAGLGAGFQTYLKDQKLGFQNLLRLARDAAVQKEGALLPGAGESYSDNQEQFFRHKLEQLSACLATDREEVVASIKSSGLNPMKFKANSLEKWLDAIEALSGASHGEVLEAVNRFSTTTLQRGLKGQGPLPDHEFFEWCDQILELGMELEARFSRLWVQLKRELCEWLREEAPRRKKETARCSYDDLLRLTREALTGSYGEALAVRLARRYPFALIDEFQDTDSVQYAIFETLYRERAEAEAWFLI
ncbi:MAG: UvrD-helicase domain-containing protein, partial [Verrucomicrobiota bacterium]